MGTPKIHLLLCLPIAIYACLIPIAAADQTTAQQDAARTHDRGSNDSLNESYGNALTAVDNFFSMNIPGAITYGVKSYGQYRNSNQLDDLHNRNNGLAGSMSSAAGSNLSGNAGDHLAAQDLGVGVSAKDTTGVSYKSPFMNIDPAFLHKGAASEIAAKLEKMSGMKRDDMLKMMADVHSHSKSPSDPNFIPWARKTYQEVAEKMPNPEFREKLESLGGYLDTAIESGLAKSTLGKFLAVDSRGKSGASSIATKKEEAPVPQAAKAEGKPVDAVPPPPAPVAEDRALASSSSSKDETGLTETARFSERGAVAVQEQSNVGMDHLSTTPVDGFLSDMIRAGNSAREEDRSPTIFQQVSKKLKEVTVRQHLGLHAMAGSLNPTR